MGSLHERSVTDADALLAIEMFCYSVRKQIAVMMVVLGGVDAIVFTGVIGEHNGVIRESICADLSWAEVHLDETRYHATNDVITTATSLIVVRVMPSQEDEQIARYAWRLAF